MFCSVRFANVRLWTRADKGGVTPGCGLSPFGPEADIARLLKAVPFRTSQKAAPLLKYYHLSDQRQATRGKQ
jgi:hypothetical protein